jgi:hypothetical protein
MCLFVLFYFANPYYYQLFPKWKNIGLLRYSIFNFTCKEKTKHERQEGSEKGI